MMKANSYESFPATGVALDPIHVGTGGSRMGRIDSPIVRDPVTRIPKIPGSSLAGTMRTYAAMREEQGRQSGPNPSREKPFYPDCAGQGSGSGHCRQSDCRVCTVFGFAKGAGESGGFAGLATFSEMRVLLFPVASRSGPRWITSPTALRQTNLPPLRDLDDPPDPQAVFSRSAPKEQFRDVGWLYLPVKTDWAPMEQIVSEMKQLGIPSSISSHIDLVSDRLFPYIVNSGLEARTSVAIDPATGSAEEGALFTYEALPRATVLFWEIICRNPIHFRIDGDSIKAVAKPGEVHGVVAEAYPYLEYLGIGGMGSRGLGRLQVLGNHKAPAKGGEA